MEDDDRQDSATSGDAPGRADQSKTCENCGERIDIEEWHPVVAREDDDGTFRVHAFCGGDCRDEWDDD